MTDYLKNYNEMMKRQMEQDRKRREQEMRRMQEAERRRQFDIKAYHMTAPPLRPIF